MEGKNDKEKILTSYMEIWIIYVLSVYSDAEHPMSQNEIAQKISLLTGLGDRGLKEGKENPIAKTVGRKLQGLELMGNFYESDSESRSIGEAFYRVVGGRVVFVPSRPAGFYYEPILDDGDVSMICAAVDSNDFLSQDEKDYLITREAAACSYKRNTEDYLQMGGRTSKGVLKLPRKPSVKAENNLPPAKASATLWKISIIQYAIRKKLKIKVVPGQYKAGAKNIEFAPKRKRESILNPYALICQNGQYYLVVTHDGYSNPTHYRLDRLYSVDIIPEDAPKSRNKYKKRDDIPVKLQRYFKGNTFKASDYTAAYPLMAYNDEEGMKKCEFTCPERASSIVIDYFGIGDTVKMEKLEDGKIIKFTVLADYENVKMFCSQQYQYITPLSPPQLVDEVKEKLREALERIGKI